jgi:hypothetical protein
MDASRSCFARHHKKLTGVWTGDVRKCSVFNSYDFWHITMGWTAAHDYRKQNFTSVWFNYETGYLSSSGGPRGRDSHVFWVAEFNRPKRRRRGMNHLTRNHSAQNETRSSWIPVAVSRCHCRDRRHKTYFGWIPLRTFHSRIMRTVPTRSNII